MKRGNWKYVCWIFCSTYSLVTSFIIFEAGTWNITIDTSSLVTSMSDETNWIWDNHTSGLLRKRPDQNKHALYLVGMAFLGGFVAGFLLRCVYTFLVHRMSIGESGRSEHAAGIVNLSFIGDNSSTLNDTPPDYDTVMADRNETTEEVSQNRFLNWLRRKIGTAKNASQSNEELPPSYASVVLSSTAEMHNSGSSQ